VAESTLKKWGRSGASSSRCGLGLGFYMRVRVLHAYIGCVQVRMSGESARWLVLGSGFQPQRCIVL
jgi:hypothetical protein